MDRWQPDAFEHYTEKKLNALDLVHFDLVTGLFVHLVKLLDAGVTSHKHRVFLNVIVDVLSKGIGVDAQSPVLSDIRG